MPKLVLPVQTILRPAPLPKDIPTIAHALGAAGYDCHLVGRMHFNGPDQTHGFSSRPIGDIGASFPGSPPPDIGDLTKGRGNRGPELEHSGAGETSYQTYDLAVADIAEKTLDQLKAQRKETGRPFFLLISLFCPHPPFIARRADFEMFKNSLPPPRLTTPDQEHPAIAAWRRAGNTENVSPKAVASSRAAYYGLVHMVDRIVGRINDAVEERENTVTIYTSDHGESLGERGLWWKSTMYDESAKVPLIIRSPDFHPGKTDDRVTSLMDLSATILGWACAADLPGHTGQDLRSSGNWVDTCHSAYYGGLMNIETANIRHKMIRVVRYKLVWFDGAEPLLFDLHNDPDEQNDLAGDIAHSDVLLNLSQQLLVGWNPTRIAQQQLAKKARTDVIRHWVQATHPPEPMRWIDPNKARNCYE